MFTVFVLIQAEIGKNATFSGFSLKSNSLTLKVPAGFPLSISHKVVSNFQKLIQRNTLG